MSRTLVQSILTSITRLCHALGAIGTEITQYVGTTRIATQCMGTLVGKFTFTTSRRQSHGTTFTCIRTSGEFGRRAQQAYGPTI